MRGGGWRGGGEECGWTYGWGGGDEKAHEGEEEGEEEGEDVHRGDDEGCWMVGCWLLVVGTKCSDFEWCVVQCREWTEEAMGWVEVRVK